MNDVDETMPLTQTIHHPANNRNHPKCSTANEITYYSSKSHRRWYFMFIFVRLIKRPS